MDLWFSEVHTPDVKLSLRTAKQLFAGKSEWQDIEVLDTPAFGKILILNGHVLFSDADDFVYNEMTVHVPMAVHPNPKKVLVIGGWRRWCCPSFDTLSRIGTNRYCRTR